MGSYDLSRRLFEYNFKINEITGFIYSGLFFHVSINIATKFLVYYLNIAEDIEHVQHTLSREFSELHFILMRSTLFGLVKTINKALHLIKEFHLKKQVLNQNV